MVSMVERMLLLAEELLDNHPRSSAARRRAVSTAYYAAFHALAKACARALVSSKTVDDETYGRVYRALEHGAIPGARQRSKSAKSGRSIGEALDLIDELRLAREDADYKPPQAGLAPLTEAREHIESARAAIGLIDALTAEERSVLAANLIVKSRRERRGP